jgi:hypothetical protein
MEKNTCQLGLTCKPYDHGNHEIIELSSIKKLNSPPI